MDNRANHQSKIRLKVYCAQDLVKQDFFSLPDPFCRVEVDGTRQQFVTEVCRDTLKPKWNIFFDLTLCATNSITITIFNNKRETRRPGTGFMGCVRIMPNMIQTLRDTGLQRLNLHKNHKDSSGSAKGQIVISLLLLNSESGDVNAESEQNTSLNYVENNGLPEGWEERMTSGGKVYYVNHIAKCTTWQRPVLTQQVSNSSLNSNPDRQAQQAAQNSENVEPADLNNRSNQRRSTRHRNYLARNTLHQAVANLTNEDVINSSSRALLSAATNHNRNNNLSIDSTSSANVNSSLSNIPNGSAHGGNPLTVVHQRSISNLSNSNLNPSSAINNSKVVTSVENLPEGYEMRIAPKGQVYFYHVPSGSSTW